MEKGTCHNNKVRLGWVVFVGSFEVVHVVECCDHVHMLSLTFDFNFMH